MELLELNKVGTFTPHNFTINKSTRCGGLDMTTFHYDASVWGDARYLDSHGFLVDNGDIDRWFQNRYNDGHDRVLPSCEGIVLDAIDGLRAMLNSRDSQCCIRKITVTIGGSTGAFIKGKWEVPKWFPVWLVRIYSRIKVTKW